jgi:hypothetical protein
MENVITTKVFFDGFRTYGFVKTSEFSDWFSVSGKLNEAHFMEWVMPVIQARMAEFSCKISG